MLSGPERSEELPRHGLLPTEPAEAFERLTRLASKLLHAPVSILAARLDGQCVTSTIGLPELLTTQRANALALPACRHVARTGTPLIVSDTTDHPLFRGDPSAEAMGIAAYAGVPIRTNDGLVVGSICVIDRVQREWSIEECAMLADVAATVMTEIRLRAESGNRVRHEAAMRDQFGRLGAVSAAALDIGGARSLNDLQQVLIEACRTVLHFDAFTFATYDPATEALHFADSFHDGAPAGEGHNTIPIRGTLSEQVVRERKSFVTTGAADSAGFYALPVGSSRKSESAIRTPIIAEARVLGVISIQSYSTNRYDESDVQVLEAMASLLASAMLNQELNHAVRASEERFRSMIEQASQVVSIFAADGTTLWVSPSNEGVLGYTVEEALGHRMTDLVHPDDSPAVAQALAAILSAPGTTRVVRHRYMHKDGSWRSLESTGRNLLDYPAINGIVVNSRDITSQVALEDQLRQSQKMEAVGQLAGGVAHDFNNLLMVITSHAAFVLEEVTSLAGGDSIRNDLEQIVNASDRAATLTRQLLAFSRKQILKPQRVELARVIGGIDAMLRRLLGDRIALITECDRATPPLNADVGQLEQVVMNLALNARDAMPQGGTITIETRGEVVTQAASGDADALPAGSYAVISVLDTGEGMDEATKRRAFEPFFTTKPLGRGTGLGLSTVYGIVTQSGGRIQIESAVGRGSRFTLWLPATGASASGNERAVSGEFAPITQSGGTVLLVEDEALVRSVARRILERGGYTVLEAKHGGDALLVWAEHGSRIDVVLSDVRMPEMGGPELARRLRHQRCDLPVVFMSGYTYGAPSPDEALEKDEILIQKPFTGALLLAELDAARRKQPALASQ